MLENLTPMSFKCLRILFLNPQDEMYGREIAKKGKLQPMSVSRVLNKLCSLSILKKRKSGKSVYYSLNPDHPLVKQLYALYENDKLYNFYKKHKDYKIIIQDILSLTKHFRNKYLILILFGSVAKDDISKTSDIDLLFMVPNKNIKQLNKDILSLGKKIHSQHGKETSTIFMTLQDFKDNLRNKDNFILQVLDSHLILQGNELFAEEVMEWLKQR